MITFFYKKSNVFSYLISLVLLLFIVNEQSKFFETSSFPVFEKTTAYLLLAFCMFAVDWVVKLQYWATAANYHLFVFLLGIYALPPNQWNNWLLLFIFFFWIVYMQLIDLTRSEEKIKKTFNASFLLCFSSLFVHEGLFLFPFLWLIMFIQGAFSFKLWLVSLLPLGALKLLSIMLSQFLVGIQFFASLRFEQHEFAWPWTTPITSNFWWIAFSFLFFFSLIRHYVDVGSKGPSYRTGVLSLFFLATLTIIFALFFHGKTSLGWVLFSMALASLSSKLFEEIKKTWLREFFFVVLILMVWVSKKSLFFF